MERFFEGVELAATVASPWARPLETHLSVYVARRPRRPFAEMWPQLKLFI